MIYRWVITGYGYGTLIRIKNVTEEKIKSFSITLWIFPFLVRKPSFDAIYKTKYTLRLGHILKNKYYCAKQKFQAKEVHHKLCILVNLLGLITSLHKQYLTEFSWCCPFDTHRPVHIYWFLLRQLWGWRSEPTHSMPTDFIIYWRFWHMRRIWVFQCNRLT